MRRVLRYLLPLVVILLLAACQQAPGRVLGTTSGGDLPNGLHLTAAPAEDDGGGEEGDLPGDEEGDLPGEDDDGGEEGDLPGEDDDGGEEGDLPGDEEGDLPGEDDQDDDEDDGDLGWRCGEDGVPNPAAERLAAELDVEVDEVWDWFCQGYGLGEIRIAYFLSAQSDTPVADLFAMYDSGLGWGEIAQQLGLKPGSFKSFKPGKGQGNPHTEDNPTGNPHSEDNPRGNPHKDTNGGEQGGNPHNQ